MNGPGLNIKFDLPTSWRHGRGIAAEAGVFARELGCRKVLLLTDRNLLSLGVVEPVAASLERENILFDLNDDVNVEPTVRLFDALVAKLDLKTYDAVVAVGGGSILDVAKGLAVIGSFGGHIRDYAGFGKVPGVPAMKIISIPTTSGTGSEVSDGVVLVDEERRTKFLVISKKICPTLALTDPTMTLAMPPWVTACSGVDALVHAVESYISKGATLVSEMFALKAVGLIGRGLRPAMADGRDLAARETMQIGATMAMTAAMNSYLGLCHALAMPLCALYHMPHGQACGMALPHVLRFNAPAVGYKVADVFRALGFIDADAGPDSLEKGYERLENLLKDVGMTAGLGSFGWRDEHMDTIVQAALASAQRPTNPRDPSEEDVAGIVRHMI